MDKKDYKALRESVSTDIATLISKVEMNVSVEEFPHVLAAVMNALTDNLTALAVTFANPGVAMEESYIGAVTRALRDNFRAINKAKETGRLP